MLVSSIVIEIKILLIDQILDYSLCHPVHFILFYFPSLTFNIFFWQGSVFMKMKLRETISINLDAVHVHEVGGVVHHEL
jgi:hypothetical protein